MPAVWGTADATYGNDRITQNTYDAAGQVTEIDQAVGTGDQRAYARYTYSPNGKQKTITDANSNLTTFDYDGFDRLYQTTYPSPATGANSSNTSDYESYGYDANGNRTSLRKRDGSVIAYSYDALNRKTVEDLPGGAASDVYYEYDLNGAILSAKFESNVGIGITYTYDYLGRKLSETSYGMTVSYQYDAAGNRTQVTLAGWLLCWLWLRWSERRMNAVCERGGFNGNQTTPGCSGGAQLATLWL